MRVTRLVLFAAAALGFVTSAGAQTYPNRPIKLMVPYPAGGAVDIVARTIGQQLTEAFKQQIVIENRPGAGGVIASEVVAKAAPDGYTLLIAASGHALSSLFYSKLPYDTFKDFTAIGLVGQTPNMILVAKTTPATSIAELIALAKAKPGALTYGHAGNGTSPHLAGELFKFMAKVDITAVPYKGGAPAINDLIGGQVPMTVNNIPEAIEHIRSGTIRALGVTTATRSPVLPDVPSIAETVPGYDTEVWWAMFGPAGLLRDVQMKVHDGVVAALKTQTVKDRLASLGATPLGGTPEELDKKIRADYEKWAPIVRAAGIKAE